MPLYEYQCDKCAHRFEVIQKYSDAPISVCPKCGGPVMKLLSSPAIQFKGSGWYITDYAKSGSRDSKDSKDHSPSSSSSSSSSSETKTETPKTETKTETKSTPES
ncbi:MAG TPA: FmdB family zinc ribbon protein [Vicinamibacterales bacterium]|nr:FmdB family zinc ribbon protein [Vicinamibacterales bacterium]